MCTSCRNRKGHDIVTCPCQCHDDYATKVFVVLVWAQRTNLVVDVQVFGKFEKAQNYATMINNSSERYAKVQTCDVRDNGDR